LRAKAQKAKHYDFRKFNDALVLCGAVPMLTLGRIVDRFIDENR
jgi:uncharacterized protein (DUF885 family)